VYIYCILTYFIFFAMRAYWRLSCDYSVRYIKDSMVNCTNYYVKTTDTTENETWNCWPSESHDLIPDFVRVHDIGVFFVLFRLSVVFVFVFVFVFCFFFGFVYLFCFCCFRITFYWKKLFWTRYTVLIFVINKLLHFL
jgi:hypothetical protein